MRMGAWACLRSYVSAIARGVGVIGLISGPQRKYAAGRSFTEINLIPKKF